MPFKSDRQYRELSSVIDLSAVTQKRIESDCYVEGYATTWEPYVLYTTEDGDVYEKFSRSCFDGCDMSDIIFQYDHEGKVYARKSNGTLIVEPDDKGLFVCADLSKSTGSKELYEEIRSGLITKMSWGFISQDYYYDMETRTIVHTKIKKIFDVSAVSIPANENSMISARKLVDGEIERVEQELRKRDMEYKQQLELARSKYFYI